MDKAFNANVFIKRHEEDESKSQKRESFKAASVAMGISAALLIKGAEQAAGQNPVDKRGGGRYA